MQYIGGSSLEELIQQYGRFSAKLLYRYALLLVHAVNTIHSANLVHGNLKSSNVFLNTAKQVLILSDFRIFNHQQEPSVTPSIYKNYASAPEILMDASEPRSSSDIWSIGYLIVEVAFKINKKNSPYTTFFL